MNFEETYNTKGQSNVSKLYIIDDQALNTEVWIRCSSMAHWDGNK
jgi:hypothetical protein